MMQSGAVGDVSNRRRRLPPPAAAPDRHKVRSEEVFWTSGQNLGTVKLNKPKTKAPAPETGVLFNRHLAAKIEFFTGVFHNSGCRWRDSQDFSKLLATN